VRDHVQLIEDINGVWM